jgi:hypothetical protein
LGKISVAAFILISALSAAILNGALFSPTHGFRGKLTNQHMLNVLSYTRSVSPPDINSWSKTLAASFMWKFSECNAIRSPSLHSSS